MEPSYLDEIRGLAQGMGLFLVEMRVQYRTDDGYDSTLSFPTMYVVGGNENDAIGNTVRIIRPMSVKGMYSWTCTAVNADHNSEHKMVTARYPE